MLVRQGSGLPIVLLHGIGSRSFSFAPLIAALDARRTVMAWDAPGYGGSAPLQNAAPLAGDYVAALFAALDAAGIARCDLVGHSLGTLVAAHAAASEPSRVRRLMLLSPTKGYGGVPGAPLPEAAGARVRELEATGAEAFGRKRGSRLIYRADRTPEAAAAAIAAMQTMTMPGYGQAAHMLGTGDILTDVARLRCPTLVAVGAEDVVTPSAIATDVAQAVPMAARVQAGPAIVPDCGHAFYLEKTANVAALIDDHFGGAEA